MTHEHLYHMHVVGPWYEIDSVSDGMCGRVVFENEETSEVIGYSWSVTGHCTSQSAARRAAKEDFIREMD